MKTFILTIACLCLSALTYSQAFRYDTLSVRSNTQAVVSEQQYSPKGTSTDSPTAGFRKENLELGGAFGLQFGSHVTSLSLSPQVGYRFTSYFSAGFGLSYSYYKTDNYWEDKDITQNYLGANFYARLAPISFLRIQAQPEIHRLWGSYLPKSKQVACLLLGAGGYLPLSGRSGVSIMLYYDVLQKNYSPYGDDIFYSIGYSFGF